MKKHITGIAVFFLLPMLSIACDICGCGIGNSYVGILPDFHKHIFGLRYRYSSMLTHVGVGGSTTYLTTTENYNTIEAWSGWNIGSKFRVMATIPYNFNERSNQGITKSKNGVGDITVSGYYQLLNNRHTVLSNKLLVQSLWIGAGIKLPAGKYNPWDKSTTTSSANLFQLGTGSTDFTLSAMYDIRLQDAGINFTTNYKINTTNRYDYKYGDKLSLNMQAYYKFNIKNKVRIAPNAGLQYEKAHTDTDKGFAVSISGGNIALATAGIETAFSKIAIGANFQTPVSQNLASGIVKANNRLMFHVSFML